MKRIGAGLWTQITNLDNLFNAASNAAAGKRSRPDVAAFLLNLEPEVIALRREILAGSYAPGDYRTFTVRDPKPRQIPAAPFRDRVVHHALTQVLEPIFERRFSPNSFACRTGMGTHAAVRQAQLGAAGFRYCLQCDIRKYFASIDHEFLRSKLERVIKCPGTAGLASCIVASWQQHENPYVYFPGDTLFTPVIRNRALPLGNQTSQFFANVYLNDMDQFIDRQCRPPVWARA